MKNMRVFALCAVLGLVVASLASVPSPKRMKGPFLTACAETLAAAHPDVPIALAARPQAADGGAMKGN